MNKWINQYTQWISAHTTLVLTILALITLALASQMVYFSVNPTPYFLGKTHPSRIADLRTKAQFTNTGEYAFIVVETQRNSIFNPDSLQTIADLTKQFEALSLLNKNDTGVLSKLGFDDQSADAIRNILKDGLQIQDTYALKNLQHYFEQHEKASEAHHIQNLVMRIQPVKKVRSIATMDNLDVYEEEGEQILDIFPLMETVPNDAKSAKAIADKVIDNPIYSGLLISDISKGPVKSTSIQVELAIHEDDSPKMIAIYNAIEKITQDYKTSDNIYIGGPPMVTAQTAHEMESNNLRLMPFVVLVVFFILFISFRSIQGVIIPLAIAIVTTLWTMSVMAMLRIPQNIITTALPVFLISIAVADAIHFLSVYYVERQTASKQEAIKHSFSHLIAPLFITSVTTIVGFLAVSNTQIIFMKEFGLFVALGIAFAFILTITLLPVLLLLFDGNNRKNHAKTKAKGPQLIGNLAVKSLNKIEQNKALVICLFTGLFILAGITLSQLKIDNQVIGTFSEDSRIRQDNQVINAQFGGTTPFSIVLTSEKEGIFKEPEILHAIDTLTTTLKEKSTVGYTYSLVDIVKRSYQQQEEADFRLPDNADRSTIAQYLFTYENAEQQEIRDVVNLSYDTTRIIITLNKDRSSEIDKVLDEINALLPTLFPENIDYEITGFAELLSISTQEIVINQFNNNFIALGLIFIVMLLLLRSFSLAIISMLPLVCTVYFIFSLMAAVNIPLDIGTALISCITFGIGIDYAIHFIVILKRECENSSITLNEALASTLQQVASPIVINSFSLAAGLMVMVTAGYAPIINLGLIIAAAMVICALITLGLLPLLILLLKPAALLKRTTYTAKQ